jgi:hypothetical protein
MSPGRLSSTFRRVISKETENENSKGIHAMMSWRRKSIVTDSPLSGDGYASLEQPSHFHQFQRED